MWRPCPRSSIVGVNRQLGLACRQAPRRPWIAWEQQAGSIRDKRDVRRSGSRRIRSGRGTSRQINRFLMGKRCHVPHSASPLLWECLFRMLICRDLQSLRRKEALAANPENKNSDSRKERVAAAILPSPPVSRTRNVRGTLIPLFPPI